ncbi:tyrosine recombinase XerC [Chromatocurvus halotolerans]|uniref:Tyrosine recombinase XerC n=1 Tax=Chromatocurvus halotolerans TaxID=1132028 RepID=A0A4R2L0C9_9GAMM|nr:tyrosine recombinase XerC [Chromatocurvus halotolerans]TCO77219.1 integrase/recombinase XerC [Chromatocurvus halotolerans]
MASSDDTIVSTLPGETTFAASVAAFLDYCRDVRQLSPHTLSNYRRDLDSFETALSRQQIYRAEQVQEAHVRHWVSGLHRRGLSGSSIQRGLSAARSLFHYLGRIAGYPRNPAAGVQAPRQARRLPKTLDPDQLQQFLIFADDNPAARRDRAMAELFYSSGLRLAELVSLNIDDIDRQERLLQVTGKGRKTRNVPVGRVAVAAIDSWLEVRPSITLDPDAARALFISSRGRRISLRNTQARLRLQGRRSGMRQDVHPHMLRHSFASHMLESSGDLRAVQELLGHANIGTTQIYTHLDFQHLSKIYDAAHPRARRQKDQKPS